MESARALLGVYVDLHVDQAKVCLLGGNGDRAHVRLEVGRLHESAGTNWFLVRYRSIVG